MKESLKQTFSRVSSGKGAGFILFGGKGGVGKTTMSAACAIKFAKHFPKKKILIFTTDPAPSLSDSLSQELSNEPIKIKEFKNLWAMEIDAKAELENFKREYGTEILDILQKGTYLSDEETQEMFSLDIPGLDEVMGLKKIIDFMESNDYNVYFLDTAPTGHTLRLLSLPELLDNWIKFLASLRWKYHYMIERFTGEERIEKADKFLLEMKRTVKKVQNLLSDIEKTAFVVVTIGEAMAVAETKDLINHLKNQRVPCQHIIINNIIPTREKSTFLKERRAVQDGYITEIKKSFPNFTITEIELWPDEIKGIDKLTTLGNQLFQ